ncbi:MAG: protein kinase [Anaerolineae bacterium]|jgi:serine/threonine-protein kinase|nr:protein kinase [Anaerolineae bacterium]
MIDELIGKRFDGYEILERIGRGGMATVYRAMQHSMNRIVAMKVLPRELMKDDINLQRFSREVNIVAQLEHRNIVPVYDHGQIDGQPYIVMRYMSAGSIDDLLRHGPLPAEKCLKILQQIAPALDYAHSRNVLHRDLKPSNVLMDANGDAFLTDFGIARIVGSEGQGLTLTTQGVVGTPSYMSPEQAQGLTLDGRSDVYSLGIMLFEMTTGRRPFLSDTPYSIAVMQVTTPPPSPRSLNPKITIAVEQVILKSLKKKPDERYHSAEALSQTLEMAIENPTNFHDTEKRLRTSSETQPHPVQPIAQSPTFKPQPQPVYPVATPQSTPHNNAPVKSPPRKRANRNMLLSVLIGVGIGCALLLVVTLILAAIASQLLNGNASNGAVVDDATETLDAPIVITTPSENEDVLGIELPTRPAVRTTPLPNISAPTPTAGLSTLTGRLIYFARRSPDDSYELYRRTLNTAFEIQLTSDLGANMYPHVSPDGERVVYQSNKDGDDFDLYLTTVAGSGLRRILDNHVDDLMPAWSPDGRRIAFASDTRGDGRYDLFMIQSDGTNLVRLLTNGRRNSHPRWSPDGTQLIFTSGLAEDARTWDIWMLTIATGNLTNLTDNDVRDSWATFNTDGTMIYYLSQLDARIAILRLPVTGATFPELIYRTQGDEFLWGLSFAADRLLFNAGDAEQAGGEVFTLALDGSDRQLIPTDGGLIPIWFP